MRQLCIGQISTHDIIYRVMRRRADEYSRILMVRLDCLDDFDNRLCLAWSSLSGAFYFLYLTEPLLPVPGGPHRHVSGLLKEEMIAAF